MLKLNWRNNSIRLLALLLAVIMWVYVSNEQNPVREKIVNAKLEHNKLEQNFIIVEGLPESVRLRIQGNQNQLNNLAPGVFKATVNIPEGKTGDLALPVQVSAPAGLRIAQVIPEEINVVVDRLISKQIPVTIGLRGTPARDFTALAPQFQPDIVTVRGPSRLVNEISQATASADIQQAAQDVTQTLTLNAGSPDVTLNPATIQVFVPIVSTVISKAVPVQPQVTGNPANGYLVSRSHTEPVTVLVSGPAEIIRAITGIKTVPVSIQGSDKNLSRDVGLVVPQGVTDIQPSRVNIQIEINEAETPSPTPPEEDTANGLSGAEP
ncbi:MAG: YbbR-like protein [Firmicutes bacterium ADurb.Bin373]|nr:MAG: YbbR-like protein [Firmicutes bacterium ADurb.Bin373]